MTRRGERDTSRLCGDLEKPGVGGMGHLISRMVGKCSSIETNRSSIQTSYLNNPQFRVMYSQTKKCRTFMLLCIFFKWLCQMLFGQYGVKFFPNILGILIFLRYYEKI